MANVGFDGKILFYDDFGWGYDAILEPLGPEEAIITLLADYYLERGDFVDVEFTGQSSSIRKAMCVEEVEGYRIAVSGGIGTDLINEPTGRVKFGVISERTSDREVRIKFESNTLSLMNCEHLSIYWPTGVRRNVSLQSGRNANWWNYGLIRCFGGFGDSFPEKDTYVQMIEHYQVKVRPWAPQTPPTYPYKILDGDWLNYRLPGHCVYGVDEIKSSVVTEPNQAAVAIVFRMSNDVNNDPRNCGRLLGLRVRCSGDLKNPVMIGICGLNGGAGQSSELDTNKIWKAAANLPDSIVKSIQVDCHGTQANTDWTATINSKDDVFWRWPNDGGNAPGLGVGSTCLTVTTADGGRVQLSVGVVWEELPTFPTLLTAGGEMSIPVAFAHPSMLIGLSCLTSRPGQLFRLRFARNYVVELVSGDENDTNGSICLIGPDGRIDGRDNVQFSKSDYYSKQGYDFLLQVAALLQPGDDSLTDVWIGWVWAPPARQYHLAPSLNYIYFGSFPTDTMRDPLLSIGGEGNGAVLCFTGLSLIRGITG